MLGVSNLFSSIKAIRRPLIVVLTVKFYPMCRHPTSCCSAAEIMSVLFFHTMRYKADDPRNACNDRFVMSKVEPWTIGFFCQDMFHLLLVKI